MSDHKMTGSSSPRRCPCGNTSPHVEFLPPIPQLIGPCDVEEWKYAVRLYLNHHGLLDFIDGTHEKGQANSDVESPGSWRRRRAHAFTILNGKIDDVMPELLSAGLRAYDDNYDFDPQELWNYIARYIRFGTRSDSLKDRMLLHLFYCGYLWDDAKFEKHEYILMRRCLRTLGIEVHPKAMREADVDKDDLNHYDREWVYSQGLTEVPGRWLTYWSKTWNASKAFDRDDFAKMMEIVEEYVAA
ncbi:hypothetical protein QR685DRAFT_579058 [Neurospora intermedia]|uniref:Uncharacterized protein n=1 Tax=Neurospora intermedia TaxID=5142 RepID=A0ABR3DUE4_NEUIN